MTRTEIIARIRAAVGTRPDVPPPDPAWRLPVEEIPDPVARFVTELEAVGGEAVRVRDDRWQEAVRQIASDAGVRNLLAGPGVDLDGVGLQRINADEAWRRPDETLGLAEADHGMAETGTLVIGADGVHAPTSYPIVSVVLLRASRIVRALEDLPAPSPDERARILVTGPSRTSDIEKRLVLGAHGPRRLIVVLLER